MLRAIKNGLEPKIKWSKMWVTAAGRSGESSNGRDPHYASHPSTESHPNPNNNDTPRDFTRGTMVKLNLCSVLMAVRVDPKDK